MDDFVSVFTSELDAAITESTVLKTRTVRKRQCLPRYILKLIRKKNAEWSKAKDAVDKTAYYKARNAFRMSLTAWRAGKKQLINGRNKSHFYRFIKERLGKRSSLQSLTISDNNGIKQGKEVAEIFSNEFSSNFCQDANVPIEFSDGSEERLMFNCTRDDVLRLLSSSPNSATGPDGYSYATLKQLGAAIIEPLIIIFQQSLQSGKFPTLWKEAKILTLYKGKGDAMCAGSYRLISLCSCLSNMLQRLVKKQLITHLSMNLSLSGSQHGFVCGRSTITNVLSCDALIAEFEIKKVSYDIIALDLKKAFDKVPPDKLLLLLASTSLHCSALNWLQSFLSGRSQKVYDNGCYFEAKPVRSGVVQGSVLGPVLFTIFLDTLLKDLPIPSFAYADDIKLVFEIKDNNLPLVKSALDTFEQWSGKNGMPLSLDKNLVLHCGHNNPRHVYSLFGEDLKQMETLADLEVARSKDCSYHDHHLNVVKKGCRAAGAILHAFTTRDPAFLWPAYKLYVQPTRMYCAQAWSPVRLGVVDELESVPRRFSKRLTGMRDVTYEQRLKKLKSLSLANERTKTDLVMVYKCLHRKIDVTASDLGLSVSANNEHSGQFRLKTFRPPTTSVSSLFKFRAPREWNALVKSAKTANSLLIFKRAVTQKFNGCCFN